MTDWTKETKLQSPHWKSEDITNRGVTAGKIAGLTSGGLNKAIHNDINADVMAIDIANAYGEKNTTDFTKETKGTIDFTEEEKNTIAFTEESKYTVDWTEETKQ